jgi:putative transposase
VPLATGFLYLAATIDWYSRYALAWRLSNTVDGAFCLDMLDEALGKGRPKVFNTDQGVQFTAQAWTGRLEAAGVAVSRDGRCRCLDNGFVEWLWRTVKDEDIYLKGYAGVPALQHGLGQYFPYSNEERYHQALDYRTPAQVYRDGQRRGAGGGSRAGGGHSFSARRRPFTGAEGRRRAEKECPGTGPGGRDVGERSSPELELRKAIFWSGQWGPP